MINVLLIVLQIFHTEEKIQVYSFNTLILQYSGDERNKFHRPAWTLFGYLLDNLTLHRMRNDMGANGLYTG